MSRTEHVVGATRGLLLNAAKGMLASLGVDAVDINDFGRDVEIAGDTFLAQCFSGEEIEHCEGDVEKLATRFALKEAALKALGTGIRGIGLRDITVDTDESGQPRLRLSPEALGVAAAHDLGTLRCSATHEAGLALAVVAAGPAPNKENR
jgi:holo-[acyl-carrier protein] synthase